MKRFFDYALCSVGGVGYIPFASGTFGSLAALLLAWYFGISGFYAFLTAVVLYAISVPCIKNVMKKTEHDPSLIVIDEVVGQMMAYAFLPSDAKTVGYYIVGFVFFRFFDIFKIQPAKWADTELRNAHGVLLDDVFAGIYAGLCALFCFLWMG